jgi:hypothetical protein
MYQLALLGRGERAWNRRQQQGKDGNHRCFSHEGFFLTPGRL